MKRVLIYTVVVGLLFIMYGCPDTRHRREECTYEYPINIKNIKDTIKTTDTLWVENDFDPRFCLSEGVYKNGVAEETPKFYKLVNDTMLYYTPVIIGYDKEWEAIGRIYYSIYIKEEGGRYKSKFGIVFPDTGVYSLSGFGSCLENKIDGYIWLDGYFDTPSNNVRFLPEKLQELYNRKPYRYNYYFISVVK